WSSGTAAPSLGTRTALTLDSHGDAFYVNGVKQVSLARSRTQTSPAPIELMRAGGTADEYGWGKLYAAYIWQNGTLQRNFVPCYRVADGLTGLYDLVTETFFPSEGDSPFLHGTGGAVGIPHFTGVYGQSRLSANTCFWNLTNFSFTVWTKNPDAGRFGADGERYGTLFSQGALGNQPGVACYVVRTADGRYTLSVQIRDKENQRTYLRTSAETLRTDGKWHHLACTYDLGAGVARLYLDGKVVDANTDPAKMVDPSLTWYIPVTLGGRSGEYPMMGELAYATLWNRAITESEVDFTRRHPVSGTEAGLIGCWSLDGGDAGLLDGVANGAAEHDLTPMGEIGFAADEIPWHVAGLLIFVR
ncbi:MAG: LamG domain-containing protein, partial [Kiritimatiellae bacterium]|nr:LamG domain-containing protein [Kiritimatiellia bacterium]